MYANDLVMYVIQKIFHHYTDIVSFGKEVVLIWVPSHQGIHGNEEADLAAYHQTCSKQSSLQHMSSPHSPTHIIIEYPSLQ